MSDLLTLPARGLRRLAVSDPGRLRLRNASSIALSALIAILAMGAIAKALHQPSTLVLVGGFIGMLSAAMVKGKTLREREITTALVFIPGAFAVGVAAVASRHPVIEDIGFVLAVFVAVWVRRYGARGSACGVIGFFAYFFSLLTGGDAKGLPMMILAVGVGVGSTLLVRMVLLREHPRQQMHRLRPALRAASTGVLDAACAADRASAEQLRARLDRLEETAMAIQDWQSQFDTARYVDVSAEELEERVFHAQISIEQTASALWALDPHPPWPEELNRAIAALRATLLHPATPQRLADAVAQARAATELAGAEGAAAMAIWQAATAQAKLQRVEILAGWPTAPHGATASTPAAARTAPDAPAPGSPASDTSAVGGSRWEWRSWNPATRAAIQCTVAAAIATVIGQLISEKHWFWAVLTTFLVFFTTNTTGELFVRGWHRFLGTVIGAVVGLVVVLAVGHHSTAQLALIVVSVFLAFYLGPLSYTYLSAFITMLIVAIFELLGVLDLRMLELRVEETLVGAAVGIGCGYFIMSTRSSPLLVKRIGGYLGDLDTLLVESVGAVLKPGGENHLVPAVRTLDAALGDIVAAAKPLESVGTIAHRDDARRWRRALQMNNRAAHVLARAGLAAQEDAPDSVPSAAAAESITTALARVRENIARLAGLFDGDGGADGETGGPDSPQLTAEHAVREALAALPHAADGAYADSGALLAVVEGLSQVNRTLPAFEREAAKRRRQRLVRI